MKHWKSLWSSSMLASIKTQFFTALHSQDVGKQWAFLKSGLFEEPALQFPGNYPLKSSTTGRFFKKVILSPQAFTEIKVRLWISVNWFEFSATGLFLLSGRPGWGPRGACSSDFPANSSLGWFAGRSWSTQSKTCVGLLALSFWRADLRSFSGP